MKKGYIYAILSAVLFGSAGLFVKLAYVEGLDSISLLTFQYIIACIIMFAVLIVLKPHVMRVNRIQLRHLAVLGIIGNTSMTVSYYKAFQYLPMPIVTILLYTYPIMVFSYKTLLRGERIKGKQTLALILAFLGCILTLELYNENFKYSVMGVLYGLSAALFFSFMNIYSEENLGETESLAINAYSTLFSLISLMLYRFPWFIFNSGLSVAIFKYTAVLAVLCEIIPLTLLYASLKSIGSIRVSIIGNLEIPTAMILSAYIIRVPINFAQVSGTILVIIAVYLLKNNMD